MDPVTGNPANTGVEGATSNEATLNLESAFSGIVETKETASEPIKGDNGAGVNELPAWTAQLPSDVKGNADVMQRLGKFKTIGDLANSYNELESKLGSSIAKPGKDASADELNAYYEKLGRPKSADDYSFSKNDTFMLKQVAFDLGLTEEQAKGIYEKLTERGNVFVQNLKDASIKQFAETDAALRQQYGNKYSEKMQFLQRGINTYGGKDLGKVLADAGVLYNKAVCDLFIKLGEMNTEATLGTKGETVTDKYNSVYNGGTMKFKGLD